MVGTNTKDTYWSGIASRYASLPAPLRVSASERAIYEKLAAQWNAGARAAPRVLVLGATPDFYHLPWPDGADLLAVDVSAGMLAAVWPGNQQQALCQDWRTMDLPDASRDVAFCDGGLSFMSYPDDLQTLADNLGRIIAPDGLFIVRLYVEGEVHESADEVMHELLAGHIGNSSELKLRLWLALNSPGGVRLDDVWLCFSAAVTRDKLASISWPDEDWESMRAYEGLQDVYRFHSVAQVAGVLANSTGRFRLEANVTPEGPCHQHLRILSFRRCG